MPDDPRHQCLAARSLQRGRRREQRADHVEGPDAGLRERGIGEQAGGEQRLRDPGEDEQPATVVVVRERAAVEPEGDERAELHQSHEADGEVRAGEAVELVGDRDVGHHRAEVGDPARGEEDPEVAGAAQRGQVHGPVIVTDAAACGRRLIGVRAWARRAAGHGEGGAPGWVPGCRAPHSDRHHSRIITSSRAPAGSPSSPPGRSRAVARCPTCTGPAASSPSRNPRR